MSVDDGLLSDIDILALDYDEKVKMLERIVQETLKMQVEFASISGRYAELKANISVYKQVGSHLQTAIKAEKPITF